MNIQMPRGAIPTPRSELAASQPYEPASAQRNPVPSGAFPSPNNELSAAEPYKASGNVLESFLAWPVKIDVWINDKAGSTWSEEAFAKACANPKVFISAEAVREAARSCGSSNFAHFMQTRGFEADGKTYLDGQFYSVQWTNQSVLASAIAHAGPVKIGIASANLTAGTHGEVKPGKNGWAVYGLSGNHTEDECASLCGYGDLPKLVDLFEQEGTKVNVPSGMPTGLCYAMFVAGSIGIIDHQSLINITGEAWVRSPVTILRNSR